AHAQSVESGSPLEEGTNGPSTAEVSMAAHRIVGHPVGQGCQRAGPQFAGFLVGAELSGHFESLICGLRSPDQLFRRGKVTSGDKNIFRFGRKAASKCVEGFTRSGDGRGPRPALSPRAPMTPRTGKDYQASIHGTFL